MTIQEHKNELDSYTRFIAENGASPGFIAGCKRMADYAAHLAKASLITVDVSAFKFDELEGGKCYTVSIDTNEISPTTARKFLNTMQESVVDRGITLIPALKQMQIEETNAE